MIYPNFKTFFTMFIYFFIQLSIYFKFPSKSPRLSLHFYDHNKAFVFFRSAFFAIPWSVMETIKAASSCRLTRIHLLSLNCDGTFRGVNLSAVVCWSLFRATCNHSFRTSSVRLPSAVYGIQPITVVLIRLTWPKTSSTSAMGHDSLPPSPLYCTKIKYINSHNLYLHHLIVRLLVS